MSGGREKTPSPAPAPTDQFTVTTLDLTPGLTLRVVTDPSKTLSDSTGTVLWSGGRLLAQYLVESVGTRLVDKTVLDLGAGVGIAGLTASFLGAKDVALTDLPELLPLMNANVQANFPESTCTSSGPSPITNAKRGKEAVFTVQEPGSGGRRLQTRGLLWGVDMADPSVSAEGDWWSESAPFNYVLGGDICYEAEETNALLRTLRSATSADSIILFAFPLREEGCEFLKVAQAWFKVEMLHSSCPTHAVHDWESKDSPVHVYQFIKRDEGEERASLAAALSGRGVGPWRDTSRLGAREAGFGTELCGRSNAVSVGDVRELDEILAFIEGEGSMEGEDMQLDG